VGVGEPGSKISISRISLSLLSTKGSLKSGYHNITSVSVMTLEATAMPHVDITL
jgi:hypothetical protein